MNLTVDWLDSALQLNGINHKRLVCMPSYLESRVHLELECKRVNFDSPNSLFLSTFKVHFSEEDAKEMISFHSEVANNDIQLLFSPLHYFVCSSIL